MTSHRWVVVGLASTRAAWFTEVARWSTMGSVPVDFAKSLTIDDLHGRLRSGRPHSAALLDGSLPMVDRDLLAELRARGCAPIVVDAPTRHARWPDLGAAAVLTPDFSAPELVDVLDGCAPTVDRVELAGPDLATSEVADDTGIVAPLIAVVGRGGAGTSTVAAALAQGLAARRAIQAPVVLADLALHAHQALLHDAGDIVPGLHELAEAHRNGRPAPAQAIDLTFAVPRRGYRLLLGLRRPQDWTMLQRSTVRAGVATLRRASSAVVADVDPDVDGEAATGSFDLEDLHLLARTATTLADLVVVVALPTVTGLHGLPLLLRDLVDHGVPAERLLVVINRAPARPRARAQVTRAIADLVSTGRRPIDHQGPVFVPVRRSVDELHRDVGRLPAAMVDPPTAVVLRLLAELGPRTPMGAAAQPDGEPVPVIPGQLGWTTPNVPQQP